jgi:hypothetical protein
LKGCSALGGIQPAPQKEEQELVRCGDYNEDLVACFKVVMRRLNFGGSSSYRIDKMGSGSGVRGWLIEGE